MSDLLIDAPLLACPDPKLLSLEDFQKSFIEYLSRLADVSELRHKLPSVKFWRDEDLALVLHENNCFPFRHSLAQAFAAYFDPEEFQLEDANILATALLERSFRLEDHSNVADVIVADYEFQNDPVSEREQPYAEHLCRVISLALPVLGDGKNFHPNTYLASTGVSTSPAVINAKYNIEMVEYVDGTYKVGLPIVEAGIEIYRGFEILAKNADLVGWWSGGGIEPLIDACSIMVARDRGEFSNAIENCRAIISFGPAFIESANDLGFMHDPKKINRLLRVLVDLVNGRNLADSHWLRKGRGANEPQRVRGDWRAWRHDVDHEFHLHYWKSGTALEIANIVVHNDFGIQ